VLLGLAATGRLHPLLAAAAMILSSLMVSARSYRLLHWTPPAEAATQAAPRADGAPPATLATQGAA
jgi:hypothetical protein